MFMFMKIHLITVVFAFYNIRIIKTTEMRFTLSWFRLWEKGCWFIYVVCRKFLRVGIDPRTLIYSLVSLLALSPRYGIFNLMVNTSLKKPSFVADHLTNVSKLLVSAISLQCWKQTFCIFTISSESSECDMFWVRGYFWKEVFHFRK